MKIRAAVLHAPHQPLVLETLDQQEPRDDEIRVRLVATGVCHTDISMMGRPFPVEQPIVLGHEGAGIVEAVGARVRQVLPGDRVLMSYNHCGHCPACQAHAISYCDDFAGTNFVGLRPDGSAALSLDGKPVRHNFFGQSSFATHALCTERNVVRVPDRVPDAVFPLLGPLGCGILTGAGAVLNVLQPAIGQSLVVFGAGAVGLAAVMAARAVGLGEIVAVDRVPSRLALAEAVGATRTVDASVVADSPAEIRRWLPRGADFSVDTTAVPAVLHQALEVLGPKGVCGFVGGAAPGAQLPVDLRDMMLKGKTLRGIVEGDADPQTFIPALIDLHLRGRLPVDRLVRTYPFAEVNRAIADSLAGSTVKPILTFGPHDIR